MPDPPPCRAGEHTRTRTPFAHKLLCLSLPSHMHASTQNVDFPCICFHAHRGPSLMLEPVTALALTHFHAHHGLPTHAHRGPCINLLSCPSQAAPYTRPVSTPIVALPHNRFHAICATTIHSQRHSLSRSLRSSDSSHTFASKHCP